MLAIFNLSRNYFSTLVPRWLVVFIIFIDIQYVCQQAELCHCWSLLAVSCKIIIRHRLSRG